MNRKIYIGCYTIEARYFVNEQPIDSIYLRAHKNYDKFFIKVPLCFIGYRDWFQYISMMRKDQNFENYLDNNVVFEDFEYLFNLHASNDYDNILY